MTTLTTNPDGSLVLDITYGPLAGQSQTYPADDLPMATNWLQAYQSQHGTPDPVLIQPNTPTQSEDLFNAGTMLSNVPSSAYAYGQDVAYPFMHPIEATQATANLGAGIGLLGQQEMFHMRTPANQNNPQGGTLSFPQTEFPKLLGNHISQRYGSWEKALKTLETDPVGVLGDLSAFLTGGAMIAPRAGGISRMMADAGKATDPLQAVSTPFKAATAGVLNIPPVGKGVQELAENSLLRAIKFSPQMKNEQRRSMVRTLLEEDLRLTRKGLDKLVNTMSYIGQEIDALIQSSKGTVSANVVLNVMEEAQQKLGGFREGAETNLHKAALWIKQQKNYFEKQGFDQVTAAELQQWKTDLYRQIYEDARNQKSQHYKTVIGEGSAQSAKQAIEELIPEIKDPNKRYGSLAEVLPLFEAAVNKAENKSLTSLTQKLMIAGGVTTDILGPTGGKAGATAVAITGVSNMVKPHMVQYLLALKNAGISDIWINNIVLPSLPEIYGITRQTAFEVGKFTQAVEEAINQSPEQTPVEAFNDQARQGLGTNLERNPLAGMGAGMPF